jgi:hypothetical protein
MGRGKLKEVAMLKKILLTLVCTIFLSSSALAEKGTTKISVFPLPPKLSANIQFYEPSGNNILDAGETGKLIITVENSGKGDAFDVMAELRVDKKLNGLSYEKSLSFGTIPSGAKVTKEASLRAAEDLPTDTISFDIEIREANGFDANPLRIAFRTKGFDPPQLVVADIGIEDRNKNARIEPMEIVETTVRVQNIGHGDAREVSVDIQLGNNVFLAGEAITHFTLGNIPVGKFRDVKFMFYTNNRIANGERIPIAVQINEMRLKFQATQALNLVMNVPQKRTQEFIVKAQEPERKPDIQLATGLSIDIDMNIPEGERAGKYDIAVVIGNKNYSSSGLPNVDFADRDARIMKEYLLRTFGYDPENILYAEDATFAKFNEFFGSERDPEGKLYKYVKEGVSRVFIYYVGHGAPDLKSGEGYFVPVDANPQYISSNGYRLQTFYSNLAKVPAKKITIILDACFSGNSQKGMLFKGISPAMVKVKKEYASPTHALLITSAAVDQVSTWYPEKKHSLFTYYFLKGLQGEADLNRDKKITMGEMKEYLKENVRYMAGRLSGLEQTPVVAGNDQEVIVQLKR